jgi:hypothetical protein
MLSRFLGLYALDESVENHDVLAELLRRAAARLGPPKDRSNLENPEFMAVHALNVVDPKNWRKKTLQTQDGPANGWEYIPPATESQHLQAAAFGAALCLRGANKTAPAMAEPEGRIHCQY